MAFNAEKKKKQAELLAKRRVAAAGTGASNSFPLPLLPPTRLIQPLLRIGRKRWWWLLVLKTRRPTWASSSRGKGLATTRRHRTQRSFRDNPLSASSPRDLIVHEGGGGGGRESALSPSSNEPLDASKTKRWWRAWVGTSSKIVWLKSLETSSSRPDAQDSQSQSAKLREELTLQAKVFVNLRRRSRGFSLRSLKRPFNLRRRSCLSAMRWST